MAEKQDSILDPPPPKRQEDIERSKSGIGMKVH